MTAGLDPATASQVWNSPIYTVGAVKFTSADFEPPPVRGRLLDQLRALQRRSTSPASSRSAYTPEWFTGINKQDSRSGPQWNAAATQSGMAPDRYALMASMSYVTGTHNVKVGVQDTWGRYNYWRNANGDSARIFQNGVPFQATILNTPLSFGDKLDADFGIFAQDSWTMNRLTLNYGARFETFASSTSGRGVAGRPVRGRAHVRRDRHADLEEHRAARRRRLRPVRQPEDRTEVQLRQVHAGRHHRVRELLQPDSLQTRTP